MGVYINKMPRNALLVQFLSIFFLSFCAYECRFSVCPNECLCYGSSAECDLLNSHYQKGPDLPHGTKHVILKNWCSWYLITWSSVTHLELLDTVYYGCNWPILQLPHLTSLKIYTKLFLGTVGILEKQSQLGVKQLLFSGIKNTSFTDVTYLLNGSRFSTVEELVIDRLSTDNDDRILTISSDFFTTLSYKTELRRLLLTNLNLNSIDILGTRCPPKFNYLSIRGSVIDRVVSHYNISNTHVCETLKTLDASETTFRHIRAGLGEETYFSNTYFTGQFLGVFLYKYFRNVENIFLNDVNNIPAVVRGVTLDFSSYKFRLRKLELSKNYLQFLNATYISHAEIGIKEFNLSFNIIEYISPRFFYHANFMRKLDLQSNRLYKMQNDFPIDFVDFFQRLSSLRYLDLSNNRLTAIPHATFVNSRHLRHLDFGQNELTMVSFSLASCANLEYLNLVGNRIYFHDISSVELLNEVIKMLGRNRDEDKINNKTEAVLKIDLSENSFSCSCDNTDMQTWMVDNSDVLISNLNKGYMCIYNGKEYNITTVEVKEISNHCYHQHVFRLSVSMSVVTSLIVLVIIYVILRRIIRNRRWRKLLRHLQDDNFPLQFLLFLSHCSADDELVIDYILPTLSQSLKEVTQFNRDYMCYGDKHFRPGRIIAEEVARSIEESAVVVLIISSQYIKSPWCDMEAKEAETQRKPIVLILTENIDEKEMSLVLKQIFNRYTRFKCFTNEEGHHEVLPTWNTLSKCIVELASAQLNVRI